MNVFLICMALFFGTGPMDAQLIKKSLEEKKARLVESLN